MKSAFSHGFGVAMLSPILSALRPDDYVLMNSKPIAVLNYFTKAKLKQSIVQYPQANKAAHTLIQEVAPIMHESELSGLADADLFDMFCHWLVAVKKYPLDPDGTDEIEEGPDWPDGTEDKEDPPAMQ